jgi:hypothetical protein
MTFGPFTRYQIEGLMALGANGWIGHAHDSLSNPPYSTYCLASTEAEARIWAERESWRLYELRERIIR